MIGVTCSTGFYTVLISNSVITSEKLVEFRTRKMNRVFMSNRDPVVIIRNWNPGQQDKTWVLLCKTNTEIPGCNYTDYNPYMQYDTCPKYELETLPTSWRKSFTLSNGEELFAEHYMNTPEGHVLVCADVYDKKYIDLFDYRITIAVSTGYSVSLLCLLTTFLIHIRYRPLRTLPGLILMNLIAALFLAQLMYLMNSLDLFHGNPIRCQVFATAQHYFWLTSFSWMACISVDIFKCLSASCTTINTYSAAKYHKYVLVSWLTPLPIPMVANVLTITATSDVGYDSTLCWLAGSKSVLYLFALPVLSVVTTNIILFVGSVCRLCALLQNAASVGRKEENKQRVLMHRHQGWNVRHGLCHIYMRYLYIYELFIAFVCFVVCSSL